MSTDKTSWKFSLTPPVTVLIPCNDVEFLRDCLTSIENQDYQNLQIVVVLNGQAAEMIDELRVEFASMKLTLKFLATQLAGIVNALNYGIEFCETEFIARIDADDLMPPSRIQLQVSEFQKVIDVVIYQFTQSFDFCGLQTVVGTYRQIKISQRSLQNFTH